MAGLLNFEVPGGMNLWDYVKQRANDPLVPPPTSRMIQNDMLNKGLEAVGMAPLGITSKKVLGILRKVDPNASLNKNYFGEYQANVYGDKYILGKTLEDVENTFDNTDFFVRLSANKINKELGLPIGSKTGYWVQQGHTPNGDAFTMNDARTVANKIIQRHKSTDYDSLLGSGISKDEARLMKR